jgi:anti-sigma B factor antagonist
VFTLAGTATEATLEELRGLADEFQSAGHRDLVVDLNQVDFIDCGAIGVLVCAQTRARRAGGSLVVVCALPHMLRLFDLTGLTRAFEIHPYLEHAFRGVKPTAWHQRHREFSALRSSPTPPAISVVAGLDIARSLV